MSVRRLLCFLMSFAASRAAFAQDSAAGTDPVCRISNSTILQKTKLNFQPSYFARVFPVRKEVGIMIEKKTYLLNLDSGKLNQIPGNYDLVPTPDEKFMTNIDRASVDSLQYWLSSDIFERPKPADGYASWKSEGYDTNWAYESLSATGTEGKTNKYRMLVDNDKGNLYIRDFSFTFKSPKDDVPKRSEGSWVRLCPDSKDLLKLPMISKDGKAASVYNVEKGVTQIYDIDEKGACKLNQSLPFQTGKADFSFDRKKVAFHMGRTPESSKWFEFANPSQKMDVYVYDLETKKVTRVSNTDQGNAYFPSFRKDGTLGFFVQEKDDKGVHYSFVIADPKLGSETEGKFPAPEEDCKCDKSKFTSMAALGTLRDEICGNADATSLEAEALLPLAMKPDECVAMVKKYWESRKDDVAKRIGSMKSVEEGRPPKIAPAAADLSLNDLTAACPKKAGAGVKGTEVDSEAVETTKNPAERLKNVCTTCHAGAKPASGVALDMENVLSIPSTMRQKMAKKIEDGEMPPGGLNDDERKTLSEYLKKR